MNSFRELRRKISIPFLAAALVLVILRVSFAENAEDESQNGRTDDRIRVLVIGAGIAGLTNAYELQKNGFDVIVLEKSQYPGGRMTEKMLGSIRVNTGASILHTTFDDMMRLIDELGLREHVVFSEGLFGKITVDGREVDPESLTGQLYFIVGSDWRNSFRLLTIIPDILKARQTDPNLIHTAARFDDESVADYIIRKFDKDYLERVIEPFFRGPWSWEPENISKAVVLTYFAHSIGDKYFFFDEGIGLLCRELASKLDIRYECEVQKVRRGRGDEKNIIQYLDHGVPAEIEADLTVLAVPGTFVPKLMSELSEEEQHFFAKVRYTKLGIVYYVLSKSPDQSSNLYSRSHPSPFAIYEISPGDQDDPGSPAHLYCELSPQTVARFLATGSSPTAEALDAFIRPEVIKLYPSLKEDLVEVQSQWWNEMLPEFYPGYIQEVASFIKEQDQSPRRIYYCGDYLGFAHTGGACASGSYVAGTIVRHWAGPAESRGKNPR